MDMVTYALCKNTVKGAGWVKGAPCEIKSIEEIPHGKKITFSWEKNDGTKVESTMKVMDGITPLMYMGIPNASLTNLDNNEFYVNSSQFNRVPEDGDLFFSYLVVSDDEKIYLYAVSAGYDETNNKAIIATKTRIATTGLKALVAKDAITQDITQDDPFDLPANVFTRMPDGDAEECLIFDRYGHYRQCTLTQKNNTTITVTPTGQAVDINIGKVRKIFTFTDKNELRLQHNLSFQYPDILIIDTNGDEIYGNVEYYSDNLLFIRFSEKVSGTAYISK